MDNEKEQLKKEVEDLKSRLRKLEHDFEFHTHNGFDNDVVDVKEVVGATITGGTFRTATTGKRIEMSSSDTSKVNFYDGQDLIGSLEVDRSGDDGFLKLLTPDGGGLKVTYDVAASAFGAVEMISVGGRHYGSGSASNAFVGMETTNIQFYINESGSGNYLYAVGLPTSNPGGTGRIWSDSGTLKIT